MSSAPTKVILTPAHLAFFQESDTYKNIISYVESLNQAVLGAKLTDECSQSQVCGQQYLVLSPTTELVYYLGPYSCFGSARPD